jgi:ADP-ribose pyrophosphatase
MAETSGRKWRVLERTIGFDGFFKLIKYSLQHELFAGGWGPPIEREVLHRGHAVAVLPYDPVSDSTLLIEQFRPGATHSENSPWLIECIAGMVEPGESEVDVVRREAREEADIEIGDVHYLTTYFPSPGGSTETISVYWAMTDLSDAGGVYGLPDEGEDIRSFVVPFDEAMAMVRNQHINNSLGIISLLWFQAIREEIQADL